MIKHKSSIIHNTPNKSGELVASCSVRHSFQNCENSLECDKSHFGEPCRRAALASSVEWSRFRSCEFTNQSSLLTPAVPR